MVDEDEQKQTRSAFAEAVNMTPSELSAWLETEESTSVGQKTGSESVGHASGRHIVEILRKKVADLTAKDYEHMSKVVGYVARHSAQRPDGDITQTRWRYSLMNWGHDPEK